MEDERRLSDDDVVVAVVMAPLARDMAVVYKKKSESKE